MTDQESMLETNSTSPTLDDILNPKKTEAEPIQEAATTTKASETVDEAAAPAEKPKADAELEKTKKRLEDTQKWGNSQRQATLHIIKNLRDKGLSDEDIAETIGGKDVLDKVLKGLPVEQELNNPVSVITQAYNQQIAGIESAFKELGHTDDELKEFMEAFNTLAFDEPEHRDEMYRRATSGEGSVAAYALKVGREKLEEYRVAKQIKTKGVKTFEQELREKIRAELQAELSASKSAVEQELGRSSGKPKLVGGATTSPEAKANEVLSIKDIFGQ
jgi:hypothetical protein